MNDIDKYYIKAVQASNARSWYDDSTEWIPGRIISVKNVDPDKTKKCGRGLHCSKELLQAFGYQKGPSDYLFVDPLEIVASDFDKIRCRSIKVIRFLSRDEIYKNAGFNLWEINHPLNPLWIDPQPIRYIPLLGQWAFVRYFIRSIMNTSVRNYVNVSLNASLNISLDALFNVFLNTSLSNFVNISVHNSVRDALWAYIGGLFVHSKMISWIYEESLGDNPWEPLQKLWYAGYVPSFDGKTWRLHAGRKFGIVWEGKL